jgi:hypothetical protein
MSQVKKLPKNLVGGNIFKKITEMLKNKKTIIKSVTSTTTKKD